MLLLYYTNTILFWLSLPNSNSNPSLGKHLDKHDFQYLPQEVCIAKCLQRMQTSRPNKSVADDHLAPTSDLVKKRPLEECVEYCSKLTDISDQKDTTVKQSHENYSLNLICRDESTLNFLINLHTPNERQAAAIKFEETDVVRSSRTSPTSSPPLPDSGQSNDEDMVLFIIKIHLANETDIFHVYLSDDKFFTVNDLLPNTTYNITAIAVHSTNKYSVIALGEQYQTLRRGYSPGNITDIKIVNFIDDIGNPTHLAATVIWKPPQDMTCYYDVICFSPKLDDFEMQPVEIRNPRQLYKYQLENLTFSTEYKVGIRAKNTKNMKESELFWKTFYAPSCAQWYNYNFNICAPEHPQNLQFQLYFGAQYVYSLNVTWSLPTHYPDNYTLSINDVSPIGRTHFFNISKEAQYFFIEEIIIYSSYFEIILTASTVGGTATTIAPGSTDSVIHFPDKTHFVKLFAAVLAPIFCVAILSMTIFMIYHRRAKLKRYQERCKYFEELEKKAPIDPKDNFDFTNVLNNSKQHLDALHNPLESDDNTALFNDDMEIERNQLTLHEVLGEGAFGLVKRGIYKDNRLGGKEHEVAVKMLKDHPTADDVRAFRREIEVMKSVEKHPNIVGIIGHCTRISNDMMLLTEYCSFGNLLDFLRDEWRFLHDIQQKRQTNTFSVVNLELPLVTTKPSQGRFLLTNNGATTQTPPMASPPTAPPPPVPSMSSLFALVNGGSHPKLETLENLKNNQHKNLNKMEIFNINSSKLIIERFKRKYNDIGKNHRVVGNSGRGNDSLRQKHLQGIEDIEGSTTNSNAISPLSCKTINGVDSQSEYTTTSRLYSQSLVSATSPPPLTSPAAENKSYGYHGCCTNSCKCNVDIIIRNIDSSDSIKDQEELDRLLLRQQQQHQSHHPIKECGTSIAIKNCDCRTTKETMHGHPTTPPPRPPATSFSENHKRKSVVENKSYFKLFTSDKHPMPCKHHSVSGHQMSLTTETTTPPLALGCAPPTNALATSRRMIEDAWPHRVPLTSGDLLDIARQVAVGMDFLSKNKVVHRDLAARNVLVAPDRTIKIADFGLSRDVYQENIYKKTGNGKLPIKWLALESLTHQVYTTQSDVWSYGILLYEIVTLGSTPYPSIPTNRLLHLLKTGYRMEKPKNCGDEFYALMHSCWNGMPNERPTFSEIIKKVDEMLNCMNTPLDTATFTNEIVLDPLNAATTNSSQDESNFLRKNAENCNDDNDEISTLESPIEQICSDDSYLKPL